MKKTSRIQSHKARIPEPVSEAVHKTERTAVADVVSWINTLIQEKELPLGQAETDTGGKDLKFPDVIIRETPSSGNILVVGEFKPPYYDPFDETELKEPAHKKAVARRAPFFLTSNFKRLILFSTEAVNRMEPEVKQIIGVYDLVPALEQLDFLRETRFENAARQGLEVFLRDLVRIHFNKEPAPRWPLDQLLIVRLRSLIDPLAMRYHHVIANRAHKDGCFEKQLASWFHEQQWSYRRSESDYDRAARQAAYLLANKILFYQVLQTRRPKDLDKLSIPEDMMRGGLLRSFLQAYFNEVIKRIDYETVFSSDFIDDIAFPDDGEVVRLVKALNNLLARYDLKNLGYDILGPIFERLIPPDERHVLGQYFTNADVVDLILGFAVRHENDVVLDPGCGAGTFLVRAYQRKKRLNPRLSHEQILSTLWGVDIAKFPAHLCTINLAINDLAREENYPCVLQRDFFDLEPGRKAGQTIEVRHGFGKVLSLTFPERVDAIVGNPPYTRQEEIEEIANSDGYKRKLIERALKDNPVGAVDINDRAGIHAYFFIHGSKFLAAGGRFGFVVSDTWLDADFGIGLKQYLLLTFRVSCILASKVERWFSDASINTCIVLLEREPDEKKRQASTARFVLLKRPLKELIPVAGGVAEERDRAEAIARLYDLIQAHSRRYENDDMRIVPVQQKDLIAKEKWGLFLRSPSHFLKILENNQKQFVVFEQISSVCRGVTSGADPWFYVKDVTEAFPGEREKRARRLGYKGAAKVLRLIESGDGTHWPIEREYLVPIARNPESFKSLILDSSIISDFAIVIPPVDKRKLRGKLVLRYISHGEHKVYQMGKGRDVVPGRTNSCEARKFWYSLPEIPKSRLLWVKAFDIRLRHYLADKPVLANQRFYPILPHLGISPAYIAGFLNSAFVAVWLEVQRAALGEGAIEATVEEVKYLPIIDPRNLSPKVVREVEAAVMALGARETGTIFEEYGSDTPEKVSWETLRLDRKRLEEVVLGQVLGLTADDQLALIQSLVDLTRNRVARAGSVAPPSEAERAAMQEYIKSITGEVVVE